MQLFEHLEPRLLMSAGSDLVPYGATVNHTAEFLAGSVAVNVVVFESSGAENTENWSATRIEQVRSAVNTGLQWWEDTAAAYGVALDIVPIFTYLDRPVATDVEPIRHGFQSEQNLWLDDFLRQVGASSMDAYHDALRRAVGTHWATSILFVDSLNDSDGAHTDGTYGYGYFGDWASLTWDSGPLAHTVTHEFGHVFYAMDQYPNSHDYTDVSGYLGVQNINAYDGNPSPSTRVADLMAEYPKRQQSWDAHTLSLSTRGQLGWWDSDADGVIDILDVTPTISGSGTVSGAGYTFTGDAAVVALANRNPWTEYPRQNATTNTLDRLEYRLDGGEWQTIDYAPVYQTAVRVSLTGLATGPHVFEARSVIDNYGIASTIYRQTFTVGSEPPPPQDNLSPIIAGLSIKTGKGNKLVFTATGVSDPDGTVNAVMFYRDSNFNGVWDAADALIGTDTSGSVWSVSAPRKSLGGALRFFAVARDNDGALSQQVTAVA